MGCSVYICQTNHQGHRSLGSGLPVVLHVLVRGDAAVVHEIEDSGGGGGQLDGGGQTAVLGQHVLVVPAPVSSGKKWFIEVCIQMLSLIPGHCSSVSDGVVELSAEQPGGELVNLDLWAF